MIAWLSRLLGSQSSAAKPAAPAPGDASVAIQQVAGARAEAAASVGQRRPLVGRSGAVVGFELRLPQALEQRLAVAGCSAVGAAAMAHHLALLTSARQVQQAGRVAMLALPGGLLARADIAEQLPAGALLLPVRQGLEAAVAQRLRQRGVLLGVPDGPPARAPLADFVVLRAAAGGLDTLLLSAQRWQEARPRLPLMALGLEGIDEAERALAAGVTWAGGRFDDHRVAGAARARPLQSAAHRICALLNDLALDRETGVVADAVRADVALSYRLLRYANSPAIGLSRGVETVADAIMLLGRAELGRWLSVMLLSAASGRQASAALQEEALARGRLLEMLGRQRHVGQAERLFTLGLMSRLHLLLQMPLAAALEPLRLSDDVRQALLHRQGPWADYLALADEIEGDDEDRFGALCAPWGGIDAVLAVAEQAWGWAGEVAGTAQRKA